MSSENILNDVYRQPETVQLAPDALVYINGSNMLKDSEGNQVDIRQDITEINTSLSVDTCPGTASFTISYPDHRGGRYSSKSSNDNNDSHSLSSGFSKYSNLKIMSEVEIYFRGRFLKEINGEKKYPYYKAFWGVVTALTENYNDGIHTISVSCADILRWWQISNAAINPSILATQENLPQYLKNMGMSSEDIQAFLKGKTVQLNGRPLSITGNIFSGLTIPQILKELSVASLLQMIPVDDYLDYTSQTLSQSVGVDSEKRDSASKQHMMKYWSQRMNDIGSHLRVYALGQNKRGNLDIDFLKLLTYPADSSNNIVSSILNSETVIYQSCPTAPAIAKSDLKSQLEIANELKEAIHYEFFMDVNGDVIFKLPFYNMDVRNNISSVLNDLDIINWNFIQSESEVITRVDVTGTLTDVVTYNQITNAVSRDPYLALQFGERLVQRSMPWLHTNVQCAFWGKAELARQNALIRQGTVTVLGRPELRLGYPVYVPSRDAFYYIKGIENRFAFGSTFTTTLTLSAERTKTENKNSIFRNVGEITDDQIVIVGGSIAEPNDINNFMKQVSMPSICTPRAKEHVSIVQPKFTIDLSATKEKFGEWKTFSDIVKPQPEGEFQLTDEEKYEIIGQVGSEPYVSYGYSLSYNSKGLIEEKLISDKTKDNAQKILSMDVQNMQLIVDANNVMYTLDDKTGKMSTLEKATIAQNAKPSNTEN